MLESRGLSGILPAVRMDPLNRKYLLSVCIAICVGYFIAGFWPFNFHPRNHVTWLPSGQGISLGRNSIIYSQSELDLRSSRGTISIEMYLQSDHEPTHSIASILSLYDMKSPASVVIAQWKTGLLLRTHAGDAPGGKADRSAWFNAALRRGVRRFIAATIDVNGTTLYMDGVPARTYPKLTVRPDTLRESLILGNAPDGHQSWQGKLFGVALFSRALTASEISRHYTLWQGKALREVSSEPGLAALYLFDDGGSQTIQDHSPSHLTLILPTFYQVLQRTILIPPWEDPPGKRDIAINILGFVPFGFFYFIYRMQAGAGRTVRNAILTVLASGIISLTIELIQVYLPTRSSQLSDVICNVGGSLLGVLPAAAILHLIGNRGSRP